MNEAHVEPTTIELQCQCGRRYWYDLLASGGDPPPELTCQCGNTRLRRTGRFKAAALDITRYRALVRDSLPEIEPEAPMAIQHSLWLPEGAESPV